LCRGMPRRVWPRAGRGRVVVLSAIPLEAEAGAVAEMQVTVAQFRVLAEEAISQRVSLRPALGLDPEDTTRRSKHKMPVQRLDKKRC
jgi:hypothetical protein